MKRKTALKSIKKVINRLSSSDLIETPGCGHSAYQFKELWIFGSIVRGEENPNDIDLLYLGESAGKRLKFTSKSKKNPCSPVLAKFSEDDAIQTLRKNIRNLRFHDYESHNDFGNIKETKVMLYPICNFDLNT